MIKSFSDMPSTDVARTNKNINPMVRCAIILFSNMNPFIFAFISIPCRIKGIVYRNCCNFNKLPRYPDTYYSFVQ